MMELVWIIKEVLAAGLFDNCSLYFTGVRLGLEVG